ncbi:LacI family DNA-binding transcriptional regulator [Tuberibacillus sp. Marseille-P3662]|uniref:LacI family DNA-binding transcriptional regulator n=1 Tax=Tuberibacillus sp. Marseille-P3662 TaxID=1965358 RepID=UPI001592CBFF|nr:LacI family DNA-binding transcriptional regulator [Tuberibacillus sp. Marseille-P3662]
MVTMNDVAKKSGFSVATVSAVINNSPVVSPKSREKILEAINDLGYRPNAIARSLKNAKTSSIGVIVRDITNPYYPEIVSGLEEVAWENNYEVFLCNTENSSEREEKYINNLLEKRVDGVVIATSLKERKHYYNKLNIFGIPYVFLNRRPDELYDHECFIGANNRLAAIKVVDHIKQMGYSEIAFLSGPQEFSTFRDRLMGFHEGMDKNRLNVEQKWTKSADSYSKQRGYEEAKKMIHYGSLPEIIFCSSDLMAFGVYLALQEKGLRIPEEIALISIDNNMFSDLIDLSSVNMQNKEMGKEAASMLMSLLKDESMENQRFLLEPELVIRKSSGASV